MAWDDSGAGSSPSDRAKVTALWNTTVWLYACASSNPSWCNWLTSGESPWYRSPPAWIPAGTKSWPRVYIFTSGVSCAVSPKSYAYTPLVSVGQEDGSTATIRGSFLPAILSRRNGNPIPARLLPPPQHAITTSG